MIRSRSLSAIEKSLAMLAIASVAGSATGAQSTSPMTITLAGQSMIRSDIRETAPAAVPIMQTLLKGDFVSANHAESR
jgi:hypothetical protein